MTKEELLKFIENNKENFAIQLKRHYKSFYDEIDLKYNCKSFSEKIYQFIHGDDLPKCLICGKLPTFMTFYQGYCKCCSRKCKEKLSESITHETRRCVICKKEFYIYKKREKTTCSPECLTILNASAEVNKKRMISLKISMLNKYGVDHSTKIPGFGDKCKQTKLVHHGDPNFVNHEKSKKTKLERYGSENYCNVKQVLLTKLEKYGDKNYNNRPKFFNTMLDLYGVKTALQYPLFKEKTKKTNLERYGVSSPLQNKKVLEKLENTNLMRYGVKYYLQSDEFVSKCKSYWHNKMYNIFTTTNRFDGKAIPMFTPDEYTGGRNWHKFKCTKCGQSFIGRTYAGNIPRCTFCYPFLIQKSQPEIDILEFLKSNGLTSEQLILCNRKILDGFELDIYIPHLNVAIEFDGIFWHSEIGSGKDKNYHLNKTVGCEKQGIRLIHIFESEWMENKELVKNKILHILKLDKSEKVHARKCSIKLVNSKDKSEFLNKYHIQGNDKASIALGAYYNNELVSIMTFGNYRVCMGGETKVNEYEMYRFCTSKNVVGIGSKLLSYFIKNYNPIKIVSYADRRWSNSDSFYTKLEFKFIKNTPPNYWYFNKKHNMPIFHRFNFRKSVLHKKLVVFDENLTEWQNMQINGWDRIWDCGSIKFEWTNGSIPSIS